MASMKVGDIDEVARRVEAIGRQTSAILDINTKTIDDWCESVGDDLPRRITRIEYLISLLDTVRERMERNRK